jgi:acetyltransferase-like isoleucine patch superfamily enzyme
MAVPILKMITVGILPSILKVNYYKLQGAKIGKNVKIGLFSILDVKDINIDDHSTIGAFTFIKCKKLELGKRVKINMMVAIDTGIVQIGNDSVIMEQVIIGGMLTPRSIIKIGKRVKVFPNSFLNPTEPITIGDDVGVGGSNYIFTHGSWQNVLDGFPASFGPVTIEKGVWLPWRVFILPNVTIGEYSIIGADSTITKNIPGRSIATGSPAQTVVTDGKFIRKFPIEKKDIMVRNILKEFVEYLNYVNIAAEINEDENGLTINCIESKSQIKYRLNDSEGELLNTHDYFIFLTKSKIELRVNVKWFDLNGKQAMYIYNDPLWEEIKNFFSRYGIRFEFLN